MVLLWVAGGMSLGIVGYFLAPLIAGAGPRWMRQLVGDVYAKFAAYCLNRPALVELERDGFKLAGRVEDRDLAADRINLGDGTQHFRDDISVTDRLHGRIWAFAQDGRPTYLSPLLAWLGREAEAQREGGDLGMVGEFEGFEKTGFNQTLQVSPDTEFAAVSLRDADPLVEGSAEPNSGDDSKEITTKSQSKFHNRVSTGQALIIIGGYALGAGIAWATVWVSSKLAASGGGSNPITVGFGLLGGGLL